MIRLAFLSPHLSFGSRNQINYNFNQLNSKIKPGAYYNGNYSIEYNPVGTFNFGIVGYYLKQINQDSKNGNYRYFRDNYDIVDTREQVLGLGKALALLLVVAFL
ncbi:transporter [Chryseobacterium wanjuense]